MITVYRLYVALASTLPLDPAAGLGGKLLYAGEINGQSRNLLYAANIAGAASLAASADLVAQRQAIRDGVIDFLVTSLEEALRILKNEIRKRQTVSVAVAASAEKLTAQMLDRGVLPDLLPFAGPGINLHSAEKFLNQGARLIHDSAPAIGNFVTWTVDSNFSRWLPRIDVCAQAVVPAEDTLRQRWLRLAPRYLGRLAQRQHGVVFTAGERVRFEAELDRMLERNRSESGEAAQVTIAAISPEKAPST
jgi:Urocanase Rossmann-like domain